MRFLETAIATFLLGLSCVEAKLSQTEFDARVKAGKFDKGRLLEKAIPYKQYLRSLEEDQEMNYEQGEDYIEEQYGDNQIYDEGYPVVGVNSNSKLQFNRCLTLETENYNLMLDNLYYYAKAGTITSIRNYVLFDFCQGNYCTQNSDGTNTYMVDLTTFIEAVVAYGPSEKERVCTACQTYGASVCNFAGSQQQQQQQQQQQGEQQGQEQDDQQDYQGNGERKLEDGGYAVFDKNMCNKCQFLDCFYDSDGDQEEDFEAIEEWITDLADCKETQGAWNNLALYGSWMCNAAGDGIEIGVFIDPYCRMYHNGIQYTSLMQDEDYQYYYQSQDVLPFMFSDVIQCRDMENVEYVDSYTYKSYQYQNYQENYQNQANGDGNNGQQNNGGNSDLAEVCTNLFFGDFLPRSVDSCGQPSNQTEWQMYQRNSYNADNQAYYQQNQQQQGDNQDQQQNMYQYIQANQLVYSTNGKDPSWYTYDLSVPEVLDGASTCNAVSSKYYATGGASGTSSDTNVYSGGSSFWNFDPNENGGNWMSWRNGNTVFQTPNAKLSPIEIAWIIIGAIILTALFMNYTRKQVIKRRIKRKLEQPSEKEVYVRADDKGNPLIIS